MGYRLEYRWVQIADIEIKKVTKHKSLAYAETQIKLQKPLRHVYLRIPEATSEANKYIIDDGIHRIHALSNKFGAMSYVLAMIVNAQIHHMPIFSPQASQYLEIFKKRYLDEEAASMLNGMINMGNIYLLSDNDYGRCNDVKFSLLRTDVTTSNVEQLPPDCSLKVFALDRHCNNIQVTGTIFGKEVEYSGTGKGTVEFIIDTINSTDIAI